MTAKLLRQTLASLALAFAQAHADAASFTGGVSLDTSQLAGDYELAFVLTDGSVPDDANTIVTLDTFAFGTGSAGVVDIPDPTQDVGGTLATGLQLRDSQFIGVIGATFTAGDSLSFHFTIDSTPEAGDIPDLLSLVLLDSFGNPVSTPDVNDFDAILSFSLDVAGPGVVTAATDLTPAPVVTSSSVPEPSSLQLFVLGILPLVTRTRPRIRRMLARNGAPTLRT